MVIDSAGGSALWLSQIGRALRCGAGGSELPRRLRMVRFASGRNARRRPLLSTVLCAYVRASRRTMTRRSREMAETEKAILAGGCFWGMQDLIRSSTGVISTRVGYTGGDVAERDLPQSRHACGGDRDHLRPDRISYRDCSSSSSRSTTRRRSTARATTSARAIARRSTTRRRAARDRRGHDRRCRRLRSVARQGRHRGRAGRTVLGGGARAPGLPRALPERLHLPLRPSGLETAAARAGGVALSPTDPGLRYPSTVSITS